MDLSYKQPSLFISLVHYARWPQPSFNLPVSLSVHLPHRMPELDLTWLGLRLDASSPWLLLLLIGASWLLARVLTQTYIFYRTYHHLCDFPQPPKWNWFLGHLGMVSAAVHCGSCILERMDQEWTSGNRSGILHHPLLAFLRSLPPPLLCSRFISSPSFLHWWTLPR